MITKKDILNIQDKWGRGIVNIGQTYTNKGDYINEAIEFIEKLYAYKTDKVLFKPTLASETQFRLTKKSALSYFIGNDSEFTEDTGFAIKGWNNVIWNNCGIFIDGNIGLCMGNYFFSKNDQEDLKVEFSIGLKKIDSENIKIILHDSHLPYSK